MSADLIIQNGKIGDIEGDWNVTEDATPVSPADSAGSVGEVRVSAEYVDGSEFVAGKQSTFTHTMLGSIVGHVDTVNISGGMDSGTATVVEMTATTPLQALNAERTIRTLAPADIRSGWFNNVNIYAGGALSPDGKLYFDWAGNVRQYPSMTFVHQIAQFSGGGFPVQVGSDGSIYYLDSANLGRIWKFDSDYNYVADVPSVQNAYNLQVAGDYVSVNYTLGATDLVVTFDAATLSSVAGWDPGVGVPVSVISPADNVVTSIGTYDINPMSPDLPPGGFQLIQDNPDGTPVSGLFDFIPIGFQPRRVSAFADNSGIIWVSYTAFGADDIYLMAIDATTLEVIRGGEIVGNAPSHELWGSTSRTGVFMVTNISGVWDNQLFSSHSPHLEEYVNHVASTCGVSFTWEATSSPVITPIPWTGNVWNKLKELCAAYGVEIAPNLTVRDAGSTDLGILDGDSLAGSINFTVSALNAAKSIEVEYYNPKYVGGIFYNSANEGKVFTVGSGQTVREIVNINGYLSEGPLYIMPYSITDADDNDVNVALFESRGGSVTVERVPGSDTQVEIILTGPRLGIPGQPSPYSISSFVGDLQIPRLRVFGYGVMVEPQMVTIYTGAVESNVTEEVGVRITNSYIDTIERAFDRGIWATTDYSSEVGLSGGLATWELRAFGETPGERFNYRDSKYRLTSMSVGYAASTLSARRHVTVTDFDTIWNGQTVANFDTNWSPYTVGDFKIRPLAVW